MWAGTSAISGLVSVITVDFANLISGGAVSIPNVLLVGFVADAMQLCN